MGTDDDLVLRLRARDESAFRELVGRYHSQVLNIARAHVPTRAIAEEVAQDVWIGVLRGIDRFEGRSSLGSWVARITSNTAKTRGIRERRSVPFASLALPDGPSVDPDLFDGPMWRDGVSAWARTPDELALSRETIEFLDHTIDELPENQRAVVMLRDRLGWTSAEVCEELGISEVNQRVLLHRGRSRLRARLADHLTEEGRR